MTLSVLKRKIKSNLDRKVVSRKGHLSLFSLSLVIFVGSLVFFCFVQLITVSVLSPKGRDLTRLDDVKEYYLEENRNVEHDIAQLTAISIVSDRAQKLLNMKRAENVIYINAPVSEDGNVISSNGQN